jgi:hypothetical protein
LKKRLFILGLYAIGCTTTGSQRQIVSSENPLYTWVQTLVHTCQKPQGSFVAEFFMGERFLFQLEGAWESREHFESRVIGVLGDEYAGLHIWPHKRFVLTASPEWSESKDVQNFISLLALLGPEGIRALTCGQYAFGKNVYSHKIETDGEMFFLNSEFEIEDKRVPVESTLEIGQMGKFDLKSSFQSGIFSKIHVKWHGAVFQESAEPRFLTVEVNKKLYSFRFSEYE